MCKSSVNYSKVIEFIFLPNFDEYQDIFTDPQIHTMDGEGYGDGNLGIRGIALFFLSHR